MKVTPRGKQKPQVASATEGKEGVKSSADDSGSDKIEILNGASLSDKFLYFISPHWTEGPPNRSEVLIFMHIMMLESVWGRIINRMTGAHGLTATQWLALGCAGREPNGVTHTELSTRLMLSTTPITSLVDRMVKAGLVERVADPSDRRVSRVVVTEEGRRRWDNVDKEFEVSGPEIPMSDEEQQSTLAALSRLLEILARNDPAVAGLHNAPDPRATNDK